MFWGTFFLILGLFIGNFLMLGSLLIGTASASALMLANNKTKYRNVPLYLAGMLLACLIQSISAITLSALVIQYTYYLTEGKSNPALWVIAVIGAIYPIWQAVRLSGYEERNELEAFRVKEALYRLLPLSLIVTIIFALLFAFIPSLLNLMFYPLIITTSVLVIVGIISAIVRAITEPEENLREDIDV